MNHPLRRLLSLTVLAPVCLQAASALAVDDRVTKYTYTASGQVATIDGPRTDVADITSYTYNAQGNPATRTNALGHVTQWTDYNASGQPTRMVDPNGAIREFTYWPRGWLKTIKVKASGIPGAVDATTTVTYKPFGKPQRITLPDGSYALYTYDAAQRLTKITDAPRRCHRCDSAPLAEARGRPLGARPHPLL